MVNVTASYSPKPFLLKGLSNLLDFYLFNSSILYFWQVLKSVHKFIIELNVLQCLFGRGYNKQKKGYDYFKFPKRTDCFISYESQVLLQIIS